MRTLAEVVELARPQRLSKPARFVAGWAHACDGGRAYTFMFYFTYVLISNVDNQLYIGHTRNIKKRLLQHQKGRVEATRRGRPLELIYIEACKSKLKSIKREKYFKSGFGRRYLKDRL